MKNVNLDKAQLNIFVEVDGVVHIATFERDVFSGLEFFVKRGILGLVPTGKTQAELREFLNVK